MSLSQLALFDFLPERQKVRRHRGPGEPEEEKLPKQLEMRIKLMRKIAFKRRVREDPNATNDLKWSVDAIWKLHLELFRDWHDRFPNVQLKSEVMDYWAWMLGNEKDPFSFRDVLVASGYRDPDFFIDSLTEHAPAWVLEALGKAN